MPASTEPDASGVAGATYVAVGASAGGLEAMRSFFEALAPAPDVCFLVAQHMVPPGGSLLPDLLGRATAMPVALAVDGMPATGGHVHVAPPGHTVGLAGDRLVVTPDEGPVRLPIDAMFRSVALAQRERTIAIVLSGMGSDGALGLKDVREQGGIVLVQDPASALHPSMPQSAIKTGLTDAILDPAALAGAVGRFVGGRNLGGPARAPFDDILRLLWTRMRHDFRPYRQPTLERRIQRRMTLMGVTSEAAYADMLRADEAELRRLHQDVLIGVTRFFRDEDAFEALAQLVIAPLAGRPASEGPIRVWAPGCSSGEEAYSLAMLLEEAMAVAGEARPYTIFATDIDARALAQARLGTYPEAIQAEVSEARLQRFFFREPAGWRIRTALRDHVVFAEHDLLTDPPFSKLDLVVCRNLLIYLEPATQRRVMAIFHFALRPEGTLFLGSAESLSGQDAQFEPVSKPFRLFRRAGGTAVVPALREEGGGLRPLPAHASADRRPAGAELGNLLHHELLAEFTPAAVLTTPALDVLYFHGDVGRFLAFPPGKTTAKLPAMCPTQARAQLRRAAGRAAAARAAVSVMCRWGRDDADATRLKVTVKPFRDERGQDHLLFVLQEAQPPAVAPGPASGATVAQLEEALQQARLELRSTLEEMEATHDELRGSNEAATSANEELQVANEELETTKEELQSVNEELLNVNQELQEKLQELEEANTDLLNFLASTETATIVLDLQLRIKRFTPTTSRLLRVLPVDVGRYLGDLASAVDDAGLLADAAAVIETHEPREHEVALDGDTWYLRRIVPYRTREGQVAGAVVTFTDVTRLRHALAPPPA